MRRILFPVLHCGPFYELVAGREDVHGAVAFRNRGQGSHCQFAPPSD